MRWFFAFLFLPLISVADDFTLTYQAQNRWAESGDGTGFAALMTYAKTEAPTIYHVILPANEDTSRDLSVARLEVLVGILEDSLGHGVLIQELDGTAAANTLRFTVQSAE